MEQKNKRGGEGPENQPRPHGPSKGVRLAHYKTCFKKLKAWGWEENPVCKLLPTRAQGAQFDPQSPHEKSRCDIGYTPAISAQGGGHRQDLELPGQLPQPTEKTPGQWGAASETGCWCRYMCTPLTTHKFFKVFRGSDPGVQREGAMAQNKNGLSSWKANLPEDVLGGKS